MIRLACCALVLLCPLPGLAQRQALWAVEDRVEQLQIAGSTRQLDIDGDDTAVVGDPVPRAPAGRSGMKQRDLLCFAQRRQIQVTCLDTSTRKPRFTIERRPSELSPQLQDALVTRHGRSIPIWTSVGMSADGTRLTQGYAHQGTLLLLRIDASQGKLVDWLVVELARGVRAKVFWIEAAGNRALAAYKSNDFGRHGTIAAIDLDNKTVVTRGQIPTLWPRRLRHGGLVILGSTQPPKTEVLRAWRIASGTEAWITRLPHDARPRQPGAAGNKVYVADETGGVHILDLQSGRVLASARLTRKKHYTLSRPVLSAGQLFIAADRLYRLDAATLKVQGSASFGKAQPFGPLRVVAGTVVVYNTKRVWLHDARTLKQVAQFPAADSWSYVSPVLVAGERLVLISQFRYNYDYQARLSFLRRGRAGVLDLRALPADAGVFEGGRLLGGQSDRSVTLPDGEHRLDLLRPGFYPARLTVQIRPAAPVALDPGQVTMQRAPTYPPSGGWGRLPDTVDLQRLFDDSPRWTKLPRVQQRMDKWFHDGSIYMLGRREGLAAHDVRTNQPRWTVTSARLQSILTPPDSRPRSSKYALAAIAPHEGLVLVITSGQLTNYLAGFDLSDGKLRWRTPVKYPLPIGAANMGIPVSGWRIRHFALHDGMIWCKRGDAIHAHDLRDGRLVLAHDAGHDVTPWGELVFEGGRLFYITVRSHLTDLTALRLYDLRQLWCKRFNSRRIMIRSSDGRGLILLGKRTVQRIDLTGRGLRTRSLAGGLADVAPVVIDDTIYICGNNASRFYAVRQTDLRLLWTFQGSKGQSDPCAHAGNRKLLAASADPSQTALVDPASGKLLKIRTVLGRPDPFGAQQFWQQGSKICFLQYDGFLCYGH